MCFELEKKIINYSYTAVIRPVLENIALCGIQVFQTEKVIVLSLCRGMHAVYIIIIRLIT